MIPILPKHLPFFEASAMWINLDFVDLLFFLFFLFFWGVGGNPKLEKDLQSCDFLI